MKKRDKKHQSKISKNTSQNETSQDNTLEISKTGDIKTNDFDLEAGKIPPLSTIKTQLKLAETLMGTKQELSSRIEFDRLRIGVNLGIHGKRINFFDIKLEDVENPKAVPSFMNRSTEPSRTRIQFQEDDEEYDLTDILEDKEIEEIRVLNNEEQEIIRQEEQDLLHDFSVKRRIRYDDWHDQVGLNNILVNQGWLIIDITGKWMAENGVLGSLHRDNIREALERIVELRVINFNVDEFLEVAQVFICDVCVDIPLNSRQQVGRYINAISSFVPIASTRHNISKYGTHGLMLIPKTKQRGSSLVIYSKGQELSFELRRTTRATRYTDIIGEDGIALAQRTLRFEVKLFKLDIIRKALNIPLIEQRVVRLNDVLNSNAPIMLQQLELFSGEPKVLLKKLEWLNILQTTPEGLTLSEIFIAERFIQLLKENDFDINIARSHIRTEYINATETELMHFNSLSNLRQNILNFLIYKKPKTISIMLQLIALLQEHYGFRAGEKNV